MAPGMYYVADSAQAVSAPAMLWYALSTPVTAIPALRVHGTDEKAGSGARSDCCGLCPWSSPVNVSPTAVEPDACFAQVPGRYPYLAALFADGAAPPSAPSCTGVAVGAATVLTSMACLADAILTDLAMNKCGLAIDAECLCKLL